MLGFVFHFKAFGIFCNGTCSVNNLPWEVKQQLSTVAASSSQVQWSELPSECQQQLWQLFHDGLAPVKQVTQAFHSSPWLLHVHG